MTSPIGTGRPDLSIYLVTDQGQSTAAGRDLLDTVVAAVAGGVTTVQVRAKDTTAREMLALVVALAGSLPEHVSLLVNDRVDVFLAARDLGAAVAGVHVGQADLPARQVRALVGPDAVIGLSTSTIEQVAGVGAHVDYVGIGVLRPTSSKADAPPPLGLDGIAQVAHAARVPAVAIGGIRAADFADLARAGLAGGAVVSEICTASDPGAAAAACAASWREGLR